MKQKDPAKVAEIADSHHNEGDTIDRRRFILSLREILLPDAGRQTPVLEPQRAKGDLFPSANTSSS